MSEIPLPREDPHKWARGLEAVIEASVRDGRKAQAVANRINKYNEKRGIGKINYHNILAFLDEERRDLYTLIIEPQFRKKPGKKEKVQEPAIEPELDETPVDRDKLLEELRKQDQEQYTAARGAKMHLRYMPGTAQTANYPWIEREQKSLEYPIICTSDVTQLPHYDPNEDIGDVDDEEFVGSSGVPFDYYGDSEQPASFFVGDLGHESGENRNARDVLNEWLARDGEEDSERNEPTENAFDQPVPEEIHVVGDYGWRRRLANSLGAKLTAGALALGIAGAIGYGVIDYLFLDDAPRETKASTIEILEGSINALEERLKKAQEALQNIGSINMRALEVYDLGEPGESSREEYYRRLAAAQERALKTAGKKVDAEDKAEIPELKRNPVRLDFLRDFFASEPKKSYEVPKLQRNPVRLDELWGYSTNRAENNYEPPALQRNPIEIKRDRNEKKYEVPPLKRNPVRIR